MGDDAITAEVESVLYQSGQVIADRRTGYSWARDSLFDKPIYVGYIKSHMEAQIFKYNPSDGLWKLILEKLEDFYLKLKTL